MKKDLLEDFYGEFYRLGFGNPSGIKFNTAGTKDMMPAVWNDYYDKDKQKIGYKAICRTVGVDEKDVKITVENNNIIVSGKTKYDEDVYSAYLELPVVADVIANIESIEYKTLNGLTYIYLRVKKPEKTVFDIKKII